MQIKDLSPDLILSNGRFYTLDAKSTVDQAVAIKDGLIVAVGGNAAVGELTGPGTRQMEVNGRTVIPGIFDSHNHLMHVGAKLSVIRLDECQSLEEMTELVRERANITPPGEWIIGQGWNEGNFIYWEGDMIFHDVGEERAQNHKPVRKYLDRGIVVMSSSDVPSTVSTNPFVAFYTLVTRKNNIGREVALHEAVTREEALRTYTINGTWLTREESLKGSIEVGKVADLAVLDRDFFSVSDEEIKDIQVENTMVAGNIVWEREK